MNNPCHNCGQTNPEPLYSAPAFDSGLHPGPHDFPLVRCRSCHLVGTAQTNSDEVAQSYTTEYYGSGSSKFIAAIERVIALMSIAQARKICRIWRRERRGDSAPAVLDIGCGRGQLLRAFRSLGASVLGLERPEFPVDEVPGGFVQVGSISDPSYADQRFDIIILWHVLEHLEKHEELLDEITSHLADGGLFIIAVPNFASLQQRIFSKYWFHLDLPRHLVHFEPAWLTRQLSERGYTIESISYMDPLQNTYGFIQSALNALAPRRLNEYYRLLQTGRHLKNNTMWPMLKWSLLSIALLPVAILENVLGTLLQQGATVQIAAKLEKNHDQ